MQANVELRLTGAMDHLRIVWQAGETLLENVPFQGDPENERYNVLLAVQEMVTNVLRHGYRLDESHPVAVTFRASRDGIRVEIEDAGPPFDPLAFASPEASGASDALTDGGYGIMIARMVMDEVSYERIGDHNVLTMAKQARTAAAVAPLG